MVSKNNSSGGVAAHYRFGARNAIAPVMLGIFFLFTGLFFGESGLELGFAAILHFPE